MGSGIAGKRRLPRQGTTDNTLIQADPPTGDLAGGRAPFGHPADLISPQPLSYEERRDRWLRNNGTLWREVTDATEATERQRI